MLIEPTTAEVTILDDDTSVLELGIDSLMTVELLNRQRRALMIPEEALVPIQRRNYVLTVGEDLMVQRRQVIIGLRQPGMVEISEGLLPGERIITRGTTRVRPGQQVSIDGSRLPAPRKD